VVPDKLQLRSRIDETAATLDGAIESAIAAQRKEIEHFAARLRDPRDLIRQARQRADEAAAELGAAVAGRIDHIRRRVRELGARLGSPLARVAAIAMRRTRIETLAGRLETAIGSAVETRRIQLGGIAKQLDAVSPLRVLERGYALIAMRRDGRVVTDAGAVEIGDELDIRLKRGRLSARTIGREV
jgi:exodeoxyribonuclease VII large subunit